MIELVIAAALAAGAAFAAGGTAVARARKRRAHELERADTRRDERLRGDRWLDVGDAVILDGGRGDTLAIVRRVALGAPDDEPFLVLLETDGPEAARAVLAYDPLDPTALAVLRPAVVEAIEALGARPHARPPSSIEGRVDGARRAFSLAYARSARAASSCGAGAPVEGLLPAPAQDHDAQWLVASYAGAGALAALVIVGPGRAPRVAAFFGARVPAARLDVLRNRGA